MAKTGDIDDLKPWEMELLNLFVNMFDSFGVPKSVAQIYGVLYGSERPLMQEEVGRKMRISTGSASQGLRFLTTIGAVQRQSIPGQRQSLFVPERSMRRLLSYFIDAQLRPRLSTGKERLEAIHKNLAHQRVSSLLEWQKKAEKALPIISTLFGK